MNRTTRRLIVAGCTVSFLGLGVTPASADIITPNGITTHATPICEGATNTIELQVRPDPENAFIRLGLTNRVTGQDYGYTEFVAGVVYLDWRTYLFRGIGLPDDTGRGEIRYTDVEVRAHYHWTDPVTGQVWEVEEVLPDACLV